VTVDGRKWTFRYAIEALDYWAEREKPSQDLRMVVTEWAFNQHTNPYRGMDRQPGFANLYVGEVRGTRSGSAAVTCTYWIDETTSTVRFDNFTTLRITSN
jgi:hypothetical protein